MADSTDRTKRMTMDTRPDHTFGERGQKLAPGATPAQPATSRPKPPPPDSGAKVTKEE
ncbi:hypothetical protein GA0070615_6242 [Micromonospora aurantiaca]|nr:hypothetical protein GA0070615_6242 [Micromonospora aurantiaca]